MYSVDRAVVAFAHLVRPVTAHWIDLSLMCARLLLVLFGLFMASVGRAAPLIDSALQQGLQTCLDNGVESGVHAWYADRPELGAEMSAKVIGAAAKLGNVIDTEVVQIQAISKRVTRYYVAIYFTRSPLWVRIERYQSENKAFFLPLRCSTNPDDILPAYVTEFLR